MSPPILVVGDTLLDRDVEGRVERLSPDAPVPVVDERASVVRPGGAGLAAALLAAEGRRRVILLSAVADDDAGGLLRLLLREAGVDVVEVPLHGPTPEKIRIRTGGRTLLRVDRGAVAPRTDPVDPSLLEVLGDAAAVLVADYGKGVAAQATVREALGAVVGSKPVVWDPHPRGPAPVPGCRLATPNRREAETFTELSRDGLVAEIARARRLRSAWEVAGVAVTLGHEGAVLIDASETPLRIPAQRRDVEGSDPCGAGDRFSAAAAAVLADGGLLSDAVLAAVRAASEFVAAGGAAAHARARPTGGADAGFVGIPTTAGRAGADPPLGVPPGPHLPPAAAAAAPSWSDPITAPSVADAVALADRVRRAGGTVVATGGCFDLLHAGHIRTLEAARALGDCLIVCLNSDESIRARKGPGRPVVPAPDRAAILGGLRCVDAVAIFSEPTPDALLRSLEPHIWAKGADYTLADLPEAATVASWGGETVVLPYLDGRSTTQLLKEALRDA